MKTWMASTFYTNVHGKIGHFPASIRTFPHCLWNGKKNKKHKNVENFSKGSNVQVTICCNELKIYYLIVNETRWGAEKTRIVK